VEGDSGGGGQWKSGQCGRKVFWKGGRGEKEQAVWSVVFGGGGGAKVWGERKYAEVDE
jgi:hypothetical protein